MHLKKGTLLKHGDYRIESVLAQGGFGITYLAMQTGLNRKVAIKEFFMYDFCERDPETSHVSLGTSGSRETVERFKTKFIKEAQTIAVLNNPHIIRIHDVFEENGTAYYVMEYHGGGTLADLVKDGGGLPERQAVHYIRQIADALQYIHERSMNHLDVKPGNVLLDEKGNAVLIDFGLAKRYDAEGNQTSTTPVGISHGYAPLEQYQQGGVSTFSPATDIYSLGATLYKLITGKTPPNATVVSEDGLPAFPSDVSSSVVSAIERAMHFRRKDRPQTVADFLALLDAPSVDALEITVIDKPTAHEDDTEKNGKTDNNGSAPKVADSKPVIVEPEKKKNKLWLWILIALLGIGVGLSALFMGGETEESSPVVVSDSDSVQVAVQEDTPMQSEAGRLAEELSESFTVNGVSFKMIAVNGGTFRMGSANGYSDESPVHNVTLSDYYIGETEVTQGLWQAVMGSNPSEFIGDLQRPVEKVTWNDCQTFIRKLNELTGGSFRLPTEAEWEYAARGGLKSQGYEYSGSNNIDFVAWYWDKSTHPVKAKFPNELGIYDMTGNVEEWCQDWYGNYSSADQTNPKGPSSGSKRVLRGGSWFSSAALCRCTDRDRSTPTSTLSNHGLRLAVSDSDSVQVDAVDEETVPRTVTAVDLGLSVKWADRNVGADSPEDYGSYFAWGETRPKSTYNWSTYKWCNCNWDKLTKYCTKSDRGYNGFTDGKTTLDLSDDAAYVNMGSNWCMPTYDQLSELESECSWTWTTQKGVGGYTVTGPNGNSIFLPAAGYRDDSELSRADSDGYYWSSSLNEGYPDYAWILYFGSDDHGQVSSNRYFGNSVRAVAR